MAISTGEGNRELRKFFEKLPQKPPTTIQFFDKQEYYCLLGCDAVYVAREIQRAAASIKYIDNGASKLEYITPNKNQFEKIVRELLLVRLYRVEVYVCANRHSNDWKLSLSASPGNLSSFEEMLFSGGDTSHSAAVMAARVTTATGEAVGGAQGGGVTVGLALVDPASRQLLVAEFADNDQFTNLETALVQLGPKECLIQSGASTPDSMRAVLQRSGILTSELKKGDFSSKDSIQDMNRLLKLSGGQTSTSLQELDKQCAAGSLAAAIKYLGLLSDSANFGQYLISSFDLSMYMRLDSSASDALDVFPHSGIEAGQSQSLFCLLNHCRTTQGQRLLSQWLKQPLLDLNKIVERQDLVEVFVEETFLRQTVREESLASLPDFQRLAKKFSRQKSGLQDCYRAYQAVGRLPGLESTLSAYSGPHQTLLEEVCIRPLKELIMDLSKFTGMVEEVLDMDQVANMEFLLKAEFDENLKVLSEKMGAYEKDIKNQLRRVAAELGLEPGKALKLESSAQLGYFLRLSRKDEKLIRGNKGMIVVDTKKDGVRFVNSRLDGLNKAYLEVKGHYVEQQRGIVAEIMKVAAGYSEPFFRLNDTIGHLDVIVSLAHAAVCATIPYCRPKMLPQGSGKLVLTEARHPCVEAQDDVNFIPNSLLFDSDHSFHIITGPNMGGKSTYIRTAGVNVLLAQIGSYIPCTEAEVSVVDSILARVGAGDSQTKGVSTFMAEMIESAAILKAATSSSLVIIDELGRGTSTYDGFGLAWAISKYIATKICCFTLFATHFHELTALAEEVDSVDNLHVTAVTEKDTLTLLYEVKKGICDQSFGIHVAEMAKFPKHVVEYAKEKARMLESCAESGSANDSAEDILERKRSREEGEVIISDFVKRVKVECANSPDSAKELVLRLRDEILSKKNDYVESLLKA